MSLCRGTPVPGRARPRVRPIAASLIKASNHGFPGPIAGSEPTTWRVIDPFVPGPFRQNAFASPVESVGFRASRVAIRFSASSDQSVLNTLAADPARLFKDREVIRRELPTDAQDLGDRRGLGLLEAAQRTVDPQADVAIFPVTGVEAVHLGLAARDVISRPTVRGLFVDEV